MALYLEYLILDSKFVCDRENHRTNMKATTTTNKGFNKTKLKVNKLQKYLKTEGDRTDYSPYTPNKKALAPNLNFCSFAASTVNIGRSFHNLDVAGMKHLEH